MQTAARPAVAHDQENVAPAAKVPQAAPEPDKKKKYVGARSASSGRPARVPYNDASEADRRTPPVPSTAPLAAR